MTVKGDLKDWLHATGTDIAKQVGAHIREKGIAYAKEQLGMGMSLQFAGQGFEQSGDGVSDPRMREFISIGPQSRCRGYGECRCSGLREVAASVTLESVYPSRYSLHTNAPPTS